MQIDTDSNFRLDIGPSPHAYCMNACMYIVQSADPACSTHQYSEPRRIPDGDMTTDKCSLVYF